MITFERIVVYEDAPTDDKYVDSRGGWGSEVEYPRSPRKSGQYRVEYVVAVLAGLAGRRFKFLLRCCCATQADHVQGELQAANLSGLTTAEDLGRMGFEEVR